MASFIPQANVQTPMGIYKGHEPGQILHNFRLLSGAQMMTKAPVHFEMDHLHSTSNTATLGYAPQGGPVYVQHMPSGPEQLPHLVTEYVSFLVVARQYCCDKGPSIN